MAQVQQAQPAQDGYNPRQLITYPAAMKMLGGVVLNTKKDIKFNRNASHRAGAERIARSKGWTCQIADINNDDEDDIVLFNKRGKPAMINGYSLKRSEHKIRQKYFDKPINERVQIGGYKSYKRGMRDDNDLRLEMEAWPAAYARIPPTPRRRPNANPEGTVYQRFIARMRPRIESYIEGKYSDTSDDHPSLVESVKKIIPMSSVLAYFYIHGVISELWALPQCAVWRTTICSLTDNEFMRYDKFKKILSKNAAIIEGILTNEELDDIIAGYTDEEMENNLSVLGIAHDDIYQDGVLPVDGTEINPEFKNILAYEKERISEAILAAKEDTIESTFCTEYVQQRHEQEE